MSQRNLKRKIQSNIINLGIEVPRESKVSDRNRDKWIPFGSDNLFVSELAERARKSSSHNSIITNKHTFVLGNGLQFLEEDNKTLDYAKKVNSNAETLEDVFSKVAFDYLTFGNAYFEVVRNTFGGTTAISLFHKDATTVRVGKPDKDGIVTDYFISSDWCNHREKRHKPIKVAKYNVNSKQNNQIVHIKDYSPEFFFYGLPDYVGALKWIEIEHKIPAYNLSRFENGFMPSAILDVFGDMGEDEAQDFIGCIKDSFIGEGKNSKLFVNILESQDQKSNLQLINDVSEGTFMDLQSLAVQNIVTAHRWRSSLAGIQVEGKLSGGKETRDDFEIVNNTVIKVYQQKLLEPFRRILRDIGFNDTLFLETSSPISVTDGIDINAIMTIDEARSKFGLDPLDVNGDVLINGSNTGFNE